MFVDMDANIELIFCRNSFNPSAELLFSVATNQALPPDTFLPTRELAT